MDLSADELTAYLQRLDLKTSPPPSLAALADLVSRHMERVPFENLDVFERRAFALSTRHAVDKIVRARRGGFCFEVNEAFRALLSTLGYTVRRIEARVWIEAEARFGAPFDHLALVVTLDGAEWLVDVGFGDNNRRPLRLPNDETADVSGKYQLRSGEAAGDLLLERFIATDGHGKPLYTMSTSAQPLENFLPMCLYHQTSPDSLFTKGLICTRATPTGRLTLTSDRLIETVAGRRREHTVATAGERDANLTRHFGIDTLRS